MKAIDLFTPSRWKSFIVWLLKISLKKLDGTDVYLEFWEVEQYMYRMLSCPKCVEKGKCIHCDCHTNGRMMNRTDHCSDGRWGLWFSKEEWQAFKVQTKLEFKLITNGKVTIQQ